MSDDSNPVYGNAVRRLWTYVQDDRPAGHGTPAAVWFAYSPDREAEHPQSHLSNFTGPLRADGYACFDQIYEAGRIQEAACWAHARRKFYDLETAHKSPVALRLWRASRCRMPSRKTSEDVRPTRGVVRNHRLLLDWYPKAT
jgi:Transposase IS66 family